MRPRSRAITTPPARERRRERVADRDRERVGGVIRGRDLVEAEDRLHHPPHLLLVGAAVPADRLLDPRRRVLSARDADGRRGDEHGSPRLPDGECDAGVCADVRLLQGDGIRRVLRDQLLDAREDREQPSLQPLARRRSPPPVARGPEAPVAFVDDPVPACSRPWVDAENLHDDTLGGPRTFPAGRPPSCSRRRRGGARRRGSRCHRRRGPRRSVRAANGPYDAWTSFCSAPSSPIASFGL